MYYLKIGDTYFKAEFSGKVIDKDWDNRESKTIHVLEPKFNEVDSIMTDDTAWSIYTIVVEHRQKTDPETGEIIVDENGEPVIEDIYKEIVHDNSDFSVRGDITLHSDRTVSVKMGKPTDLEQAYEILYGGAE